MYIYIDSCQFVVTANGDYSLHLTNPDILVDWKLVEQIVSYISILQICQEFVSIKLILCIQVRIESNLTNILSEIS